MALSPSRYISSFKADTSKCIPLAFEIHQREKTENHYVVEVMTAVGLGPGSMIPYEASPCPFPLNPATPRSQRHAMAPGDRSSCFLSFPCSAFRASPTCPNSPANLCRPTNYDGESELHFPSMDPSQVSAIFRNRRLSLRASLSACSVLSCRYRTRLDAPRKAFYVFCAYYIQDFEEKNIFKYIEHPDIIYNRAHTQSSKSNTL